VNRWVFNCRLKTARLGDSVTFTQFTQFTQLKQWRSLVMLQIVRHFICETCRCCHCDKLVLQNGCFPQKVRNLTKGLETPSPSIEIDQMCSMATAGEHNAVEKRWLSQINAARKHQLQKLLMMVRCYNDFLSACWQGRDGGKYTEAIRLGGREKLVVISASCAGWPLLILSVSQTLAYAFASPMKTVGWHGMLGHLLSFDLWIRTTSDVREMDRLAT